MAGDYIPWHKGLVRKPEVAQIARRTGLDAFSVSARLMCVWEWADEVTISGHIEGADQDQIDMIAMHIGFADAMMATRPGPWLVIDRTGATFPNYDRWNGQCAKRRQMDAERKRRHRATQAKTKYPPPPLMRGKP
jgi:hypothetical protein